MAEPAPPVELAGKLASLLCTTLAAGGVCSEETASAARALFPAAASLRCGGGAACLLAPCRRPASASSRLCQACGAPAWAAAAAQVAAFALQPLNRPRSCPAARPCHTHHRLGLLAQQGDILVATTSLLAAGPFDLSLNPAAGTACGVAARRCRVLYVSAQLRWVWAAGVGHKRERWVKATPRHCPQDMHSKCGEACWLLLQATGAGLVRPG